ncbi:MAG: hypothetical protein E7053_02710 [Lentisphaerae bacterium]|nr:hypothetical protein [Lentisphaerota bacterium]
MAKKIKKFTRNIGEAPRRGGEKMRRAAKQLRYAVIAYIILVCLAALVGVTGKYQFSEPSVNGFALCFLVLPAYLPLLFIGCICRLLGCPVSAIPGQEAVLLGICDLILILNVWWIVRMMAVRKQSVSILKNARTFILIMVCWGVFQIGCSVVQMAWQYSGFHILHEELK